MPGKRASGGSISRFGNYSAPSRSLRCVFEKGEQKANRDTRRLEIAVTQTKQRKEPSSTRDKNAPF